MKQNPVLSAEAHFYLKTFTGRQRKSLHIRIRSALAQGFVDSTGNREWWQEGAELVDWSFFSGQRPGKEEPGGRREGNPTVNVLFYYWKCFALRTYVNLQTRNADNTVFNKVAMIYFKSMTKWFYSVEHLSQVRLWAKCFTNILKLETAPKSCAKIREKTPNKLHLR